MSFPAACDAFFHAPEIFGLLAPSERAGVIGVVMLDIVLNRRNAPVERIEDRVLEPLP